MFKKYKKVPIVVNAIQFTNENKNSVYKFLQTIRANVYHKGDENSPQLIIPTLEGEMTASIGDYIIQGINGELYPCKPEIFDKTYIPIDCKLTNEESE